MSGTARVDGEHELAFTSWKLADTPLCIHSQRPWRNGWQFVCCTGDPVEARMCAKTSGDSTCAASSRRFRSFHAGSIEWKAPASRRRRTSRCRSRRRSSSRRPSSSAGSGRSASASACRAAPRAGRAIPSTPASGTSVREGGSGRRVVHGLGCFCEARQLRSMSATSMSAMSWVKPRRTTTRSAARSVRFSGNVYAGTCQPRSRSAFDTSKTV